MELLATLPAVHQRELLARILEHPLVAGVRYNTGVSSAFSPGETLALLAEAAAASGKELWVDLKCRQLRIHHWATPGYGRIVLDHEVEVELPARVYFRGDDYSELRAVRGDTLYVDPPPRHAVGEGQAVNIVGAAVRVRGYLTEKDCEYAEAARRLGLRSFMLSFVEGSEDIAAARDVLGADARLALKIESCAGLRWLEQEVHHEAPPPHLPPLAGGGAEGGAAALAPSRRRIPETLVAACDDLGVQLGSTGPPLLRAVAAIARHDPNAILASRLFESLEHGVAPTLADFSHIQLHRQVGFRRFMLSDGICWRHFDRAMAAWASLAGSDDDVPGGLQP
ncbi:MAG: hypothetical protein HYV63_31150 [Candidatus Schekmanbacteria bacterium]|nr:hypothetical protein [Candidatus Schekmanbacteria bacterium]